MAPTVGDCDSGSATSDTTTKEYRLAQKRPFEMSDDDACSTATDSTKVSCVCEVCF